jgi:hypothetical protein
MSGIEIFWLGDYGSLETAQSYSSRHIRDVDVFRIKSSCTR